MAGSVGNVGNSAAVAMEAVRKMEEYEGMVGRVVEGLRRSAGEADRGGGREKGVGVGRREMGGAGGAYDRSRDPRLRR